MSTETAAWRQEAADRGTDDHYPSCPYCGNLCGLLAVICVDCGTRLKLSDDELRSLKGKEEE